MRYLENPHDELEALAAIVTIPDQQPADIEHDSHRLSFETATAILGLRKLPKDLRNLPADLGTALQRAPESEELVIQATFRAKSVVEGIYQIMLATHPRGEAATDNRSYDPLEKECNAVESQLRHNWWNRYYLERTRPAKAGEFRTWLREFVHNNGESAASKLSISPWNYETKYGHNPDFARHNGLDGLGFPIEMKMATADLRLIPGWGSTSLYVMEPEGLSVEKTLSGTFDHNQVFRHHSTSDQWQANSISVPHDAWTAIQASHLDSYGWPY